MTVPGLKHPKIVIFRSQYQKTHAVSINSFVARNFLKSLLQQYSFALYFLQIMRHYHFRSMILFPIITFYSQRLSLFHKSNTSMTAFELFIYVCKKNADTRKAIETG